MKNRAPLIPLILIILYSSLASAYLNEPIKDGDTFRFSWDDEISPYLVSIGDKDGQLILAKTNTDKLSIHFSRIPEQLHYSIMQESGTWSEPSYFNGQDTDPIVRIGEQLQELTSLISSLPVEYQAPLNSELENIRSTMELYGDDVEYFTDDIQVMIDRLKESFGYIGTQPSLNVISSDIDAQVYEFDLKGFESYFLGTLAPDATYQLSDSSKIQLRFNSDGKRRIILTKDNKIIKDRAYNSGRIILELNENDMLDYTQQPGTFTLEMYSCPDELEIFNGVTFNDMHYSGIFDECKTLIGKANIRISSFSRYLDPLGLQSGQTPQKITGAAVLNNNPTCNSIGVAVWTPEDATAKISAALKSAKEDISYIEEFDYYKSYDDFLDGELSTFSASYPLSLDLSVNSEGFIDVCGLDPISDLFGLFLEGIAYFEKLAQGPYNSHDIQQLSYLEENYLDLPGKQPEKLSEEYYELLEEYQKECPGKYTINSASDFVNRPFKDTGTMIPLGRCANVVSKFARLRIKILKKAKQKWFCDLVSQGILSPEGASGLGVSSCSYDDRLEGKISYVFGFDSHICSSGWEENRESFDRLVRNARFEAYREGCTSSQIKERYKRFIPERDAPTTRIIDEEPSYYINNHGQCAGMVGTALKYFAKAKFIGGPCLDEQNNIVTGRQNGNCFEVKCDSFSELTSSLSRTTRRDSDGSLLDRKCLFQSELYCLIETEQFERNLIDSEEGPGDTDEEPPYDKARQDEYYFEIMDSLMIGYASYVSIYPEDSRDPDSLLPGHAVLAHSCDFEGRVTVYDPDFPDERLKLSYNPQGHTWQEPTYEGEKVYVGSFMPELEPRNVCEEADYSS